MTAEADRTPPARVAVLGAGNVGGDLARSLLARGHVVTPWNRTPEKIAPLAALGARPAHSAATAVASASVVFISLPDYDTSAAVLQDVDVSERIIVQMSGGSAAEAEALGADVRGRGGRYVDATLFSYPRALLDGTAVLFLSGAESDTDWFVSEIAQGTGWDVTLAGDSFGAAKRLSAMFEAVTANAMSGFLLGAAIADATGMPVRRYAEVLVPRVLPIIRGMMDESTAAIESGEYRGQMAIDLWRHGVRRQVEEAEHLGIDAGALRVLADQMDRCVDEGLGAGDFAALFPVIRGGQRSA